MCGRIQLIKSFKKVIVNAQAQCPPRPLHLPPALPHDHEHGSLCEPFRRGCSTVPTPNHHPVIARRGHCKAQAGFPAVAEHNGCASAVTPDNSWAHAKCCAGELGHIGPIQRKPQLGNVMIRAFATVDECLNSPCPFAATTTTLPCRCPFPSHVCAPPGTKPDCVPAPSYPLSAETSCFVKGDVYSSIPACHNVCNLDTDCAGFEVSKYDLRTCTLFNQRDECYTMAHGSSAPAHTYTKPGHISASATIVAWGVTAMLILWGLILVPIIASQIAVSSKPLK